jgi:hypothetical protein
MDLGESGQTGGVFVDLGIVFHRARAKRVEHRVDAGILLRQASVVTDEVELGYFRQGQIVPDELPGDNLLHWNEWYLSRW